jgi:carboxyl-terminal processing protease
METRPANLRRTLSLLIIFALGLAGGIGLDRVVPQPGAALQVPAQAHGSMALIVQAWDLIQKNYVDRAAVQATPLAYGAIAGMVDALGDTGHTRFMTPEARQQEHDFSQGAFEGIGAEVEMADGHVVIVAPLDGSPAQKAGLKHGDTILRVDGQDVSGLSLSQVVGMILGPAGTSVTLTILDPQSGTQRQLVIVRAKIDIPSVSWAMIPGTKVADIRLSAFSQGTTGDLVKALQDARQTGATAIVLDLRNNPGGLLDEAVGGASQFLSAGTVLQERDATGSVKNINVKRGGTAPEIPMVTLIDGGTASAAEIVAGALQDAGRSKLVGQATFGTGTVLNEFPLSDGSAILLATQEWLTPKGRVIWHKGIQPDVQIALAAGASPLLPSAIQGMTQEEFQQNADQQLLSAVNLLTGAVQARR